jgi:hypothetical protein
MLRAIVALLLVDFGSRATNGVRADQLMAGAAKVDITDRAAGPVNDPLFVKALVMKNDTTTAALITLDAVAVGEIGHIKNDYLAKVRARLETELRIRPTNVLVNASHCHGVVCSDVEERTARAVKAAADNLVPVRIGVGAGREDRIMDNRRLKLKSGRTADVRHAYSLPPDDEVTEVGPVDPEIGVLRLDRLDGRTLAVVYNFACHPIQGVPGGGNTADITGFASQVIEDNLSVRPFVSTARQTKVEKGDAGDASGPIALFVQGCGGDVNPISYKDVDHPRSAEPLGAMLGLSTLHALRRVRTSDDARFAVINETITLPRADNAERIAALEAEQSRLLKSLRGTSLNLKTFLSLSAKYALADEFPSAYAYRYLQDKKLNRPDLDALDAENRRNMKQYMQNIYTMEELTRLETNLALLKKHHASGPAAGKRTIDVEVAGLRVGDFVLITFPGELVVQIGLNIKNASPHEHTFVAGYTNGYIYYCPTAEQLLNVGGAQEDSDCLLAPEWQKLFEAKVSELLKKL